MAIEKLRLNALRAFDLVARTGSFTRAAEVLNVTRPAISKQIKLLETEYSTELITRYGPKLILTETGERLAAELNQGFDLISAASARVQASRDFPRAVHLLVERDFATTWLADRIGDFLVKHPGLPVEITSEQNGNLRLSEDYSFRIFYGIEGQISQGRLTECRLCDWIDLPLCTADYAADHVTEVGFQNARFLTHRHYDNWEGWFKRTETQGPSERAAFVSFTETALCLRAAETGAGIVLGDTLTALDIIDSDRLVVPILTGLRSRESYGICVPEARETTEAEQAFQRWLIDTMMAYQAQVDAVLATRQIAVLSR